MAAIVAVVIAIVAFNFYFKANEATEKTQKAYIEIEKKSEEIQKNLDLITYEQAKSKATELESFGDSYKNLEEKDLACESYRAGLEIMKNYQEDQTYKELKVKSEEVCKKR